MCGASGNGQAELIVTNYPNSRLSAHTKLQTVLEFRDIFVANPDYFTMGKSPLSMEIFWIIPS